MSVDRSCLLEATGAIRWGREWLGHLRYGTIQGSGVATPAAGRFGGVAVRTIAVGGWFACARPLRVDRAHQYRGAGGRSYGLLLTFTSRWQLCNLQLALGRIASTPATGHQLTLAEADSASATGREQYFTARSRGTGTGPQRSVARVGFQAHTPVTAVLRHRLIEKSRMHLGPELLPRLLAPVRPSCAAPPRPTKVR
jgi:hypothetical protein